MKNKIIYIVFELKGLYFVARTCRDNPKIDLELEYDRFKGSKIAAICGDINTAASIAKNHNQTIDSI